MSSRSLGRAAVVWGRSTSWAQNAVLDPPGFVSCTLRARTAPLPGRQRLSEASDGVLQGPLLRGGLALPADAGGVGLLARPLED